MYVAYAVNTVMSMLCCGNMLWVNQCFGNNKSRRLENAAESGAAESGFVLVSHVRSCDLSVRQSDASSGSLRLVIQDTSFL